MSKQRLPDNNICVFLKSRLSCDNSNFFGHESERENVKQILQRTVDVGESNSVLLIGPRGCGKSTLVNSVLTDLFTNKSFEENSFVVMLNGLIHTDDRLALNDITLQLKLENAVDGKVFGSFAENLSFLLACLKSGNKKSKSVIFILEDFHRFCAHHNQTLLYNLFDVSQSEQAPVCVLGMTCRLDVIELLEKRVKSRFSHRQVFIFPNSQNFDEYVELFEELLRLPTDEEVKEIGARVDVLKNLKEDFPFAVSHFDPRKLEFSKRFTDAWNKNNASLVKDKTVLKALHSLFEFDVSMEFLKLFLFRLAAKLNPDTLVLLTPEVIAELAKTYEIDSKVELLCGLSVVGFCLVIAMKHHSEIFDRDPFNFEIIYQRFNKFAKLSTSMQGMERSVVFKAYEHLRQIELILPARNSNARRIQPEFEMHNLTLTFTQINQAVQKYQALPTEITQWAQSSLV